MKHDILVKESEEYGIISRDGGIINSVRLLCRMEASWDIPVHSMRTQEFPAQDAV